MSKKIAVLITDEFEDSEFTSPAEAFTKAGHEVVTIEMQAGKTVKGKQGKAEVKIDKDIDHVSPAEFDALLLPGGHSPDGRKMTCVKAIAIDLRNAGADFYDKEVVVDDDKLVTSRTPEDLPAFNRESLRILNAA